MDHVQLIQILQTYVQQREKELGLVQRSIGIARLFLLYRLFDRLGIGLQLIQQFDGLLVARLDWKQMFVTKLETKFVELFLFELANRRMCFTMMMQRNVCVCMHKLNKTQHQHRLDLFSN